MVKNNVSVNLVKIRIKMEYGLKKLKNGQNPYRIRVIRIMWHVWLQMPMMWYRGIFVAFTWTVCHGQLSTAAEQLIGPNSQFALELYRYIRDIASFGENVFFSPFSVSLALGNILGGAREETKMQIAQALNMYGITGVHNGFRDLLRTFTDPTNNYTLRVANGLFGRKEFNFNEMFRTFAPLCFETRFETVDFANDLEGSRQYINDWAANVTHQTITELFSPGAIKPDSVLVIANAVYFKGLWSTPFEANRTTRAIFNLSPNKQRLVQMMMLKEEKLQYTQNAAFDCRIIELPYLDEEVALYVFLPNTIDGISKLETALSVDRINSAIEVMQEVTIDVTIPKFQLTESTNLRPILKSMGINDLFDVTSIDVSGIGEDSGVVISEVVHQAYVDVNDSTDATAAAERGGSAVGGGTHVAPFNADHPFLFLIRETSSGSVLFMGRLNTPEGEDFSGGNSVRHPGQLSVWVGGLVIAWQVLECRPMN